MAARRALKRVVARQSRNDTQAEVPAEILNNLKLTKKALKTTIVKSKEQGWTELLRMVESDIWGKPYKLVMKKLQGPPVKLNMEPTTLKRIVLRLFPTRDQPLSKYTHGEMAILLFTTDVINEAFKRMVPRRKVPGHDGLSNSILVATHKARLLLFKGLFNKCLTDGIFLQRWKMTRLVLLRKGQKQVGEPKSYRLL